MAESHRGLNAIATVPSSVTTALRRTMVLGLPVQDAHRPTFYFDKVVDWAEHDSEDQPWDFTQAPDSESQQASVQPVCAYEFFSPLGRSGAQYTEVGDFFASTLVFTFVSAADFAEVQGASHATVGPRSSRWFFRYWRPALGLGGIQVFQATFQAEDTE